eukprot:GHVU01129648.1.p2 GENE.GHVU01129648.1~~GHVU01129648.1.p2  ORF type:complete len:174 (-),score=19.45 GHVU01129648.1:527-1048(-)
MIVSAVIQFQYTQTRIPVLKSGSYLVVIFAALYAPINIIATRAYKPVYPTIRWESWKSAFVYLLFVLVALLLHAAFFCHSRWRLEKQTPTMESSQRPSDTDDNDTTTAAAVELRELHEVKGPPYYSHGLYEAVPTEQQQQGGDALTPPTSADSRRVTVSCGELEAQRLPRPPR